MSKRVKVALTPLSGITEPHMTSEEVEKLFAFPKGAAVIHKITKQKGVVILRGYSANTGISLGITLRELSKDGGVVTGDFDEQVIAKDPDGEPLEFLPASPWPVALGSVVQLDGMNNYSGKLIGYVDHGNGDLFARYIPQGLNKEERPHAAIYKNVREINLVQEIEVTEKPAPKKPAGPSLTESNSAKHD